MKRRLQVFAQQRWHTLACLFLIVTSCTENTSESNQAAPAPAVSKTSPATDDSTSTLGTLPTAGDSLQFHRRLSEEIANVDPNEEGWESEAFTEFVNARMKEMGKLLLHPEYIDHKKLSAWVVDNGSIGKLRLEKLNTAMKSAAVIIARSPGSKEAAGTGANGLAQELSSLSRFVQSAKRTRVKFKVMHVELSGQDARTRMLFEFRGKGKAGWRQITSTWHCNWKLTSAHEAKIQSIRVSDYQQVTPGGGGNIEFVDIAPAVLSNDQIYSDQFSRSFDYWRARSDRSLVADLLGAQGVVIGDVNGDLLDDVYVLQPGGLPNRLFLHQKDGAARDASKESGIDILDFCRSALLVDLDNDADQDLALALAWTVALFENDGTGKFTARGKIHSDGQINSMAAADYDNDGDIDIYICGRDASGAIKAEQGALGIPMPYYDANNGGPNMLLQNVGGFTFNDVTREVGMDINNRRFSLACAWEDFDNDGDQDLYVSNDFGRNNLWRNDDGVFTDIAVAAGVVDIGPGMSAAWGDHNGDGFMDLYIGNMWSNAGNRITLQQQFLPEADESTRQQARRHARGNSVYINNGDRTFEDTTRTSGANMARWAWSSNFIDLNNDGRQDLVVANGMITAGDTGDL